MLKNLKFDAIVSKNYVIMQQIVQNITSVKSLGNTLVVTN